MIDNKLLLLYKYDMETNAIKKLQEAVNIVGTQTELARIIGVNQSHISNWIHRDKKVPPDYCIPIEKAVGGKVTRHELNPKIYPLEYCCEQCELYKQHKKSIQ